MRELGKVLAILSIAVPVSSYTDWFAPAYSGRNPVGAVTAALYQDHIRTPGHVADVPWAARPTYRSDFMYNRDTRRRSTGTLTDAPALLVTPDQGGLAPAAAVAELVAPAGTAPGSSMQQNTAVGWNPDGAWCSTKGTSYRETRFPASTASVHEHSCSGASRTVSESIWDGRNDSCGVLYETYRVDQRWSDAVTSGYPTSQSLLSTDLTSGAYDVTVGVKGVQNNNHHVSGVSEQLLSTSVWDVSETRRSAFTCSASVGPADMTQTTRASLVGDLEPIIAPSDSSDWHTN